MLIENLIKDLLELPLFSHYYVRTQNPLGGHNKKRRIENPNDAMRIIHQRLMKLIRSTTAYRDGLRFSTGARPGWSRGRHVRRHLGYRYLYLVDLHDAYHHVNLKLLALILCTEGFLDEQGLTNPVQTGEFLKEYCSSEGGGLVMGGNSSPDLFNIYCDMRLDRPLVANVAAPHELNYTRYLDDLLFSSDQPITRNKRVKIREIVESAGFSISHHKVQLLDLSKGPASINGVGLTLDGRTFLPRHYAKRISGVTHQVSHNGVSLNVLHGHMGVFWEVSTEPNKHNSTERRLLKKCRRVIARHS